MFQRPTPFTGDRTGHEDEILGTKKDNNEYAYQWASIQTVGRGPQAMLDGCPVQKGDTLVEIVIDLLDSAKDLVQIERVLMNREFDSQDRRAWPRVSCAQAQADERKDRCKPDGETRGRDDGKRAYAPPWKDRLASDPSAVSSQARIFWPN